MLVPPGFVNLKLMYKNKQGHHCVTNWGLSVSADPTESEMDAYAATIAAAWKPALSTSSSFDQIVFEIGNDGPNTGYTSVSGAGAGTRSSTNWCTAQIQRMALKKTALKGRKFRGRFFVPDIVEANVDDFGVLNSTETSQVGVIINALNPAGTLWTGPVLLHNGPTVPTPITGFVIASKVATLRRRYDR